MPRLTTGLAITLAAASLVLTLTGCRKKPPEPPPVADTSYVGTWIEVPDENDRYTLTDSRPGLLRQLVLRNDHTFEMAVLDESGNRADASGNIEGTWDISERKVTLTVSTNTLSRKYRDWAVPQTCSSPLKSLIDGGLRCYVSHPAGVSTYKRTQP